MRDYAHLLRDNPHFARLWGAQVVSLLGDWFNTVVLAVLVAEFSDGSGEALSIFLLARFLPTLIFSPSAGVLVDRFNRKYILVASDLSRAAVVPLYLLADGPERLWIIYVVSFVQFSLSSAFEPGRNAITPSLIPHKDLVLANTLASVTWSVMLAVGAIAGGLVAAGFGTSIAILVDSATFLVSALLIVGIKPQFQHQVVAETGADAASDDRSFMEGLRFIRRNPASSSTLLVKSVMSFVSLDMIVVTYGTVLFVVGENGTISMSIFWSAFGVGAIIGPFLTNLYNDGSVRVMRRLIVIGFVLYVVGWLLLGAAPTLGFAALLFVVRAMGGSINWTYSSVLIQKTTPDAYLGRMFSIDMAGFWLAQTLGILITGQLLEWVGPENVRTIVYSAAIFSILPLAMWLLIVRALEKREAAGVPVLAGD